MRRSGPWAMGLHVPPLVLGLPLKAWRIHSAPLAPIERCAAALPGWGRGSHLDLDAVGSEAKRSREVAQAEEHRLEQTTEYRGATALGSAEVTRAAVAVDPAQHHRSRHRWTGRAFRATPSGATH